MTTAKERLEIILKEHKTTVANLIKDLDVQRHIVASVVNGKVTNVSVYLAEKLCALYPEYSKLWLLTGDEPKYAVRITGDTNIEVDESSNKRENSGSGNYFEGADAAAIHLQIEIERLKVENENLKANLEKMEAERDKLLNILINK